MHISLHKFAMRHSPFPIQLTSTAMRRLLLILLFLTMAATAFVFIWSRSGLGLPNPDEVVSEEDRPPPGAWNPGSPLGEGLAQDPDELARLLALPYAAGERLATAPGLGVVVHDLERAQPGLNFYVSGHASEAILIDMDGKFLHRWSANYRETFPENPAPPATGRHNFRRAALLANGDIIVLWHGGGLSRLDLRSRVKWAADLGFYNDLFYKQEEDGSETLIALHKTAESRPRFGDEPVLNDQLLWIDPDSGETLRRLSLLDVVVDSEWARLLTDTRPHPADLLHANTITVLDHAMVESSPFQAGWILFSLREISLIGVLNPDTNDRRSAIVWGLHGPFRRQHEPVLLPGGELLVFDNQGIDKDNARVLKLSLDGDILWRYPDPRGATPDRQLSSDEVGVVQPLANGNLLIVESTSGRAIELAGEDIVWQFETPHRAGADGRLIATLMDLQRVPRPNWLPH